ncbi:uncharacterized protein LOC112574265 [Pomacea canaliculata]|nr:uncharacterized protein LOC112574265 [Pomacea canaliculata]
MARLNLTNFTYTNTVPWWNSSKPWMNINVTGLNPYSRYNVSIRLIAQYEGLHNGLGGDSFNTSEDVPLEGASFSISPYTCFMGQNSCVSCVIYFKEIPRALRQANVTNYTLEGNLERSQRSMSNCKAGPSFKVYASGEANSIMVESLMPDSFYTLTLTAHTIVGSSQDSACLLDTSDLGDSVDVELEMKSNLDVYKLYWNNARWENKNVTYYVHYCYSDKSFGSFNCKTNRVIEQSDGSKTQKIPKYFGSTAERKSLRPLFFLSVVENGKMSGLYPEKWRYDMDKAPGPVDLKYVMKSDSQPTDLQVMFERTDEDKDNPQHGRPTVFVIRWTKITEKQKQACDSCTVPWIDGFDTLEVESYARGPFLLKGLEPSTLYCVWVRAERVGQNSPWVCASATTGQTGGSSSSNPTLIIVLVLIMFAVLTAAGVFICQWRRRCHGMRDKMKVIWPQPPALVRSTVEDSVSLISPSQQGFVNPFMINTGPRQLLSRDSGIYDGIGDAMCSEFRPGDETEVQEILLPETGINSVFHHTRFEPTMDIVRESPAQASERPDDEESGQGIPRYGLVTAACSDSASSFHGEREEEEENKWENSIKKDVTEDEQITVKFDMKKTPLEKYDLDESAPKEYDPEKSSGMLTSSTDALNLSKLPNFLFGKSDSVVSCDPHEDSEDGEEAKVVSQQNSCARSGHCNLWKC